MKKTLLCAALVSALALTVGMDLSYAQRGGGSGGGHSGGGGWSGGSHGGNWSGGSHGNWSGSHGNWSGGHNWNGGRGGFWRGGRFYGGLGLGLAIGLPFAYWGYPYYAGYPYYDPYYYPVYAGPVYADPAYADPAYAAPVYGESRGGYTQQDPGYRYYCPDPPGYYPTVQNCSREWMKVMPDGAPRGAPPPGQPR